ncbi:hypothetical protein ABFT23_20605 [Nocardioides sp. C4-1]|uniref:hypothetical protein n=1 Tax=Nocardioides sp. C4-1 TaxID=3151851 RepID=UPI003266E783
MPALSLLNGLRAAWITLVVLALLTGGLGWPRTTECYSDFAVCDGTSGSWWAVGVGGALLIVAGAVFVVWAVAVGTRLAQRVEQERVAPVEG